MVSNWLHRQLTDVYVRRARYENYRARSAFKLIEIDDKYKFLKPGIVAVDIGAAPGSWMQVMLRRCLNDPRTDKPDPKTCIIGIDINGINPLEGAHVLPFCDFTKPMSQAKILSILDGRLADVVTSDMAPNASGHDIDNILIRGLQLSALQFSLQILKPKKGIFLYKLWQSSVTKGMVEMTEKFFDHVKIVKPPASRADSAEIFVLARSFKGIKQKGD